MKQKSSQLTWSYEIEPGVPSDTESSKIFQGPHYKYFISLIFLNWTLFNFIFLN